MVIRQAYLDKIKPFIGTDLIKIITGIRRSGKSVVLTQIMDLLKSMDISEDQFIYYDLEKEEYSNILNDVNLYQEIVAKSKAINKKIYIFLDEIQKVENWEKLVNSLRVNLDSDIYITGSNSQLLSSELSTFLAGRYVQFEIFPFSFKEFSLQYQEVRPLDNL
ncbi:MAG: AAA family ATPase, partial [Succinivibrio sp.]|nr:AAA family ATPase [Succinivibrio sp.]